MGKGSMGKRRNVGWNQEKANANNTRTTTRMTRSCMSVGSVGRRRRWGVVPPARRVVECRALTEIPRGKNGEWPDEEDWEKHVEEEHGDTTKKRHQATTPLTKEAAPPSVDEAAPPPSASFTPPV